MRRFLFLSIAPLLFASLAARAAEPIDELLPVRGLAIEAPSSRGLNEFLKFIEEDLAPAHFNLLILRVDWNYDYQTHPELRDACHRIPVVVCWHARQQHLSVLRICLCDMEVQVIRIVQHGITA